MLLAYRVSPVDEILYYSDVQISTDKKFKILRSSSIHFFHHTKHCFDEATLVSACWYRFFVDWVVSDLFPTSFFFSVEEVRDGN